MRRGVLAAAALLSTAIAVCGISSSALAELDSFEEPAKAGPADDRYIGYYYPKPSSVHVYKPRARTLPEMNRARRIGFVVSIMNLDLARPHPPVYAMFAKGDEAEKLIIVANQPQRLDTVYRVRALLAMLTSVAREMPLFREYQVEDWFTFLDLAKLLGFRSVTVSDGDAFTHHVIVE